MRRRAAAAVVAAATVGCALERVSNRRAETGDAPPAGAAGEAASQTAVPAPAEAMSADPEGPASIEPEAPQRLVRALWVDAFHSGLKSPMQVEQLVADARAAGVNTLVVQVRRRGDAYYTRTSEPRTDDPELRPGFDALQAALDAARAGQPRLEVHAWIATVPIWRERDRPPANPDHAFNRHGPSAGEGENWISLNDAGEAWDGENYMLDPGHPAAAQYVAGVAEELVRNYDVDGLHLDLIRYAGVQWGYNPVSVARYNQRSGAAGRPGRDDPRWQQWRRDQVTGLVRRIYLDCLAVRPRVKVTAATIGWGSGPVDERTWRTTSAYRNVFQDWLGWLHNGIVDVVMPMHYDNERDPTQKAWFDQWLAWVRERKGKRQVAAGVGLFLNTPADGLAQIRRALEPSAAGARLDGVALYSYAVTNEPARGTETPTMPNAEFLRALAGPSALHGDAPPPFGERAVPPAMPWKVDPGAHVRGTALLTGAAADGAIVRYEGPDRGEAAVDGNGFWGVVDLKPGSYVFTLLERGAARGMMAADLAAGQVTQVNLAGQ